MGNGLHYSPRPKKLKLSDPIGQEKSFGFKEFTLLCLGPRHDNKMKWQ